MGADGLRVGVLATEGDVEVVAVVGHQGVGLDRRRRVVAGEPFIGQVDHRRGLPGLVVEHAVDLDRRGGARNRELAQRGRCRGRRRRRGRRLLRLLRQGAAGESNGKPACGEETGSGSRGQVSHQRLVSTKEIRGQACAGVSAGGAASAGASSGGGGGGAGCRLGASGSSVSTFRTRGLRKPQSAASPGTRAMIRYIRPMPRPGPTPITLPTLWARLPPGISMGLKTLSARGPALKSPRGVVNWAITRRMENTRPWTSGGVLVCQIAVLQLFWMGRTMYQMSTPNPTRGSDGLSPASTKQMEYTSPAPSTT